jgi:hypothetical protein
MYTICCVVKIYNATGSLARFEIFFFNKGKTL